MVADYWTDGKSIVWGSRTALIRRTVENQEGSMREKKTYQPWMDKIQVGSILKTRSGDLRVVRDVKHRTHTRGAWKGAKGVTVYLAIRRCSWTRRCYTVLSDNDLTQQGFSYVGARLKLKTEADYKIATAIESRDRDFLSCCDVRGVP
jgi:hypothetical protein